MVERLRRVLVRAPRPEDLPRWRDYGWRSEPDPAALAAEHEALAALLEEAGSEVVLAQAPLDPNPDSIYVFDPALIADGGAVLLQPGKELRAAEPTAMGRDLDAAGVPVLAELPPGALAEGGDTLRLDEETLLVGRGYRTNDAGIEALRAALPKVEVIAFDLPHWRGRSEVMHLLSLLSPLDRDLVVAFTPLLPVRLAELLGERGVRIVEVADDEFESMGPNVLALAPRVALALARNRETRRRLEAAGVEVLVYDGVELSKGDGGPTCLTLPLLRGH